MKKSVESLVLSPEVNPKEKNLFSIENSFQNTGKGNIQMYQKEVQFSHEAFEDHIHIYISTRNNEDSFLMSLGFLW